MSDGWRKPWHVMIGFALIAGFFTFAAFVAYLLYGPGITVIVPDFFGGPGTTTETVEPLPPPPPSASAVAVSLDDQPGARFECEDNKMLKAEFGDATVRLALSDGRILTLPQIVTAEGEIRYENTDGSFAFLNTENTVFVEENDVVTYENCTASAE